MTGKSRGTLFYIINSTGIIRAKTEYGRPIYNLFYLLPSTLDKRLIEIRDFVALLKSGDIDPNYDVVVCNDNYVRILDDLVKFGGRKIMLLLNSTQAPAFNRNIVARYGSVARYYRLISDNFITVFLSRTQLRLYQQWLKFRFKQYVVLPNYTVDSRVAQNMNEAVTDKHAANLKAAGALRGLAKGLRSSQACPLLNGGSDSTREREFYEHILPEVKQAGRPIVVFYKQTDMTRELISALGNRYFYVVLDHLSVEYPLDQKDRLFHGNLRDLRFLADCHLFIHTSKTEGMPGIIKNCLESCLPFIIPDWNRLAGDLLTPYRAGLVYRNSSEVGQLVGEVTSRIGEFRQNAARQFRWLQANMHIVTTSLIRITTIPRLTTANSSQYSAPGALHGLPHPQEWCNRPVESGSVVIFITCPGYYDRLGEYNRPRYNLPVVLRYYGFPVVFLEYTEVDRYLRGQSHLSRVLICDAFGGYRRVIRDKIKCYTRLTSSFPHLSIQFMYVVIFSEPELLARLVRETAPIKRYLSFYYLHSRQQSYMQHRARSLPVYCVNESVGQYLLQYRQTPDSDGVAQLPSTFQGHKTVVFYKPDGSTYKLASAMRKIGRFAFLFLTKVDDSDPECSLFRGDPLVSRCRLHDMSVLRQCFAFIHTSQAEGFPTIIKDCFEFGLPVIIPSYGGLSELLFQKSRAGIVYHNDRDILDTVRRIWNDTQLHAELSQGGHRLYHQLLAGQTELANEFGRLLSSRSVRCNVNTRHRFVIYMIGRNVAQYVRDAVESVLRQRCSNWRVIYIDDCSDDDTLQQLYRVIEESGTSDRFDIIRNSERMFSCFNLRQVLDSYLEPDEVLIQLDPDDYLASDPFIFNKLDQMYSSGATWMTYGRYLSRESDGLQIKATRPNREEQYQSVKGNQFANGVFGINFQALRSFYGHLAKQVDCEIFRCRDGGYHQFNNDVALMKSLFQLCPTDKIAINPEPFYVYRVDASVANPEAFRNRNLYPELGSRRAEEMAAMLKFHALYEISTPKTSTQDKARTAPSPPTIATQPKPAPKVKTRKMLVVSQSHQRSRHQLESKSKSKKTKTTKRRVIIQRKPGSYIGLVPFIHKGQFPDNSGDRRSMLNQINIFNTQYLGNQM